MVNNDGDGYRACPDKASDFVCWVEEGPTEIMGVVEDGDPPFAAHYEDDVEGLIELCHFFVGVCFEVHHAVVARLVHHGEQVEEGCSGGVEGHDGVFLSSTSATWREMRRGRGRNNDNDEMPSPRGFETNWLPLRSSLHLMNLGAEGGSHQFPLIASTVCRGLSTS